MNHLPHFAFASSKGPSEADAKPEMFPSKDICLCAVSALIGAIIVLLVFVLLSRCGSKAIRTRKVPQEHDERMG